MGADAVVCDYDRCTRAGLGRVHHAPVLAAAVDPYLILAESSDFSVALFRAPSVGPVRSQVRAQVLAARRRLHVPLLLAAVFTQEREGASTVPPTPDASANDEAITVVIPTRSQPERLARCLASLRARASHPQRVRVHVVANRADAETVALVAAEVAAGNVTASSDDRVFNWAALNNAAARLSDAPLLLFLNDDTEMLTCGWDDCIADLLASPDVGIGGARLLYPDMTIQHAGITLAMADGYPRHAGRGDANDDAGPQGYWTRRRSVDAVSGACLAVRRDVFDAVRGFDEAYPVNHADVLFCLAVRALGKAVVYDGTLDVVHAESRTRDDAMGPADRDWENDEVAALVDRYRSTGSIDYSPYWPRLGLPYDGYVAVDAEQAVAVMGRAARAWVTD